MNTVWKLLVVILLIIILAMWWYYVRPAAQMVSTRATSIQSDISDLDSAGAPKKLQSLQTLASAKKADRIPNADSVSSAAIEEAAIDSHADHKKMVELTAEQRSAGLAPGPTIDSGVDCPTEQEELRDPPTLRADEYGINTQLEAKPMIKCVAGRTWELQSYYDRQAQTDQRPVGPAYVLKMDGAIKNLNINFKNNLGPSDQQYDCGHHSADVVRCTNLHTHGFHVSPKSPSDDVFLSFSPADPAFQYQFEIPASHPPGTHWLHAHLHGSTAPQVKNGMAGALILKGEIDDWLENEYGIGGDKDKIMILQQLEDADENPLCGISEDGQGRSTSINGQCLPSITVQAGEVQHWRLIHAGVSATVNLMVKNSFGDSVTMREYARDGVTLQGAQDQESLILQPGYRSDVLIKIPQCPANRYPCTLLVVDDESAAQDSLWGREEPHNVIAEIKVTGLAEEIMMLPPSNSTQFASPYPFIADQELLTENGEYVVQDIWFANEPNPAGGTFKTVNGKVYPEGETTSLKLDTATLWKIWVGDKQESSASHPFHIHVNPFQVTDRDINGRPFHYWKDTLLISGSDNKGADNAIVVRSRYEDFDGEFVLHCHNLNHEDQGMMKKVEIKP